MQDLSPLLSSGLRCLIANDSRNASVNQFFDFPSNSGVIYQYSCPGCAKSYIGKTDNTLFNRTKQHGWSQKDSAIRKHFLECDGWKELVGLFEVEGDDIDTMQFQVNMVRENTKVIGKSKNWLTLAFRESLAIKQRKPELNKGLKSCKELSLF